MRYNHKPAAYAARAIVQYRLEHRFWPRSSNLAQIPKYLGNGCFGAAYLLPDGKVLKVSREFDGTAAWINDSAQTYRDTGKPGQWQPEVYAFGVASVDGVSYWWAVMEFVTPAREMSDYCGYFPHANEAEKLYPGHDLDDCHPGNWGFAKKDGRTVLFDPSTACSSPDALRTVLPNNLQQVKKLHGPAHMRGRWAQ